MALHQLEIFPRVECGRALHPRMDGIAGDDVKLLVRGEDEPARVVVNHRDARVLEHVVVLLEEIVRDLARDERFDLADDDALDAGIRHESASRDTGAEADDEHGPRFRADERRQVAEHALQPHVGRIAARFDLAADVEIAGAVLILRYRDRGVDALADVEHLRLVVRAHDLAAEGVERGRGRRHDGGNRRGGKCDSDEGHKRGRRA